MAFEITGPGVSRRFPPLAAESQLASAGSAVVAGPGYRFDGAAQTLRACFEGTRLPDWRVLRIGPSDLALSANERVRVAPGRRGSLSLLAGERRLRPVPVEVTDVAPAGGRGLDVAVRLLALPLGVAREIYGVLDELRRDGHVRTEPTRTVVAETIEADRSAAVLRALLANGCGGLLLGHGGARCAIRPARVQARPADPLATPRLRWECDGPLPSRPTEIVIEGLNSIYRLPVENPDLEDGWFTVALPDQVVRERRRHLRRTLSPAGLDVAWRHSLLPSLHVERPVRDLSLDGLSFWTRPTDDLVIPGLELDEVVVRHRGRTVAQFAAEVRQISQSGAGDRVVGGMRLQPRREQDRRAWAGFVQDQRTPDARTGQTSAEESWELFEASGYFRLSDMRPEEFAPVRSDFGRATDRFQSAPELGCQVVYPSRRGVEASISIVKLYSGTYFPGQLARRPGDPTLGVSGRKILRDIHLRAYEHLQADPDFRWLLVFVHEDASWTQMAYRDFPRRYLGTGEAWVERFSAWAAGSAWLAAAAPDPQEDGLEVGVATPSEVARLLRRLHATRGAPYVDALDLVPSRVHLGRLRRRWSAAQLDRQRGFLVARREGQAVAAALLETGERGLHLFNMFDAARVYGLRDDVDDAPRRALLRAAAPWFAERGRTNFTYFLEEGGSEHAAALGLRPLGGANQLIMSSAVVPDFLECIFEVTAPGLRP